MSPLNCPQCGRTLINRLFDHCGWCGADLPEALLVSSAEKELMREKRRLKEEERLRRARKKSTHSRGGGDAGWDFWVGGDGGGDGGGE